MILRLHDGTEFTITDFTSNSFLMECATFADAVSAYQTIAPNISIVTVENDGEVVFSAEDLISDGVQMTPTDGGTFLLILYYHGARASGADDEYATIGRILMGEEE